MARSSPNVLLLRAAYVVRDLAGAVLSDERVRHRFIIEDGLIWAMELATEERG